MELKFGNEINFEQTMTTVFNILAGITDKDKELILANCSCIFLPKRKMVFREGETPEHLICLISGQVKLFREGVASKDWITRMINAVELLGHNAFFAEEQYAVSALTIQDSVICKIEKETVFNIFKKNPKVVMKMLKLMAAEVGQSLSKAITLTHKHIRARLAEVLVFLSETYGFEDDGKTLKVVLSRDDLANLSNMTTSNAIRTLSAFSTEGLISLDGRRIELLDLTSLEQISTQVNKI